MIGKVNDGQESVVVAWERDAWEIPARDRDQDRLSSYTRMRRINLKKLDDDAESVEKRVICPSSCKVDDEC